MEWDRVKEGSRVEGNLFERITGVRTKVEVKGERLRTKVFRMAR